MGSWRVFRAEWERLLFRKTTWACALLLSALAGGRVFAGYLSERASRARIIQERLMSGANAPSDFENSGAYAPLVDGLSAGLTLATLLLLMISARSLAADRESGLLRLATTRSCSRSSLVLGRILTGVPLVLGAFVFCFAGAWLVAGFYYEFGPVLEDGYELASEEYLLEQLSLAAWASLPALLSIWSFGILISSVAKTAAGALCTALAIFLGFDLFKEVLGQNHYWVFASFAPSIVDTSAMSEMGGIARGHSDAILEVGLLRMNYIVTGAEAFLFVILACVFMHRKAL